MEFELSRFTLSELKYHGEGHDSSIFNAVINLGGIPLAHVSDDGWGACIIHTTLINTPRTKAACDAIGLDDPYKCIVRVPCSNKKSDCCLCHGEGTRLVGIGDAAEMLLHEHLLNMEKEKIKKKAKKNGARAICFIINGSSIRTTTWNGPSSMTIESLKAWMTKNGHPIPDGEYHLL